MATRETFAAGRIESAARTDERSRLMAELVTAEDLWRRQPWDHGAEARYHLALEELIRFEEQRS